MPTRICPDCNGVGILGNSACETCAGAGEIRYPLPMPSGAYERQIVIPLDNIDKEEDQ